jgi:hypothetical protein
VFLLNFVTSLTPPKPCVPHEKSFITELMYTPHIFFLFLSQSMNQTSHISMVTSVPPYETFSLIKNNILHQSKNYKNYFENSNFRGMWPLVHVVHVIYIFINMLFISTGIVYDKLRPQMFPFKSRLLGRC